MPTTRSRSANSRTQLAHKVKQSHTAEPAHAAKRQVHKLVQEDCIARVGAKNTTQHTPVARRKGIPLSPLATRMLHDLELAGLSERTQEAYLRAVRKFAQFTKRSPDVVSENDLTVADSSSASVSFPPLSVFRGAARSLPTMSFELSKRIRCVELA